MAPQCCLRLAFICLTLCISGCFPELSVGDIMNDDRKHKFQAMENVPFQIVQSPQRNVEHMNNKYLRPRINLSDGYPSAEIKHLHVVSNKIASSFSSGNDPVELSNIQYNNENVKRITVFQTAQQK
ncbi:hypothetical protein DNTS_017176, partial [Danionella cerebrum]